VNKIILIFIFLFLINCSFNKNSKFWSKSKEIKKELDLIEIFKKEETLKREFNSNVKVRLISKPIKNSFINNFDNNNGRTNFTGLIDKSSRYNFSKIKDFSLIEPELSLQKDAFYFFDNKGSILKFQSSTGKLLWKKNIYTNREKKMNPIIFMDNNNEILIVADTISKYYAINSYNGELVWKKNNTSPFYSQIKIYKDKFFVLDFENVLRCFSIKNGDELWNIKSEKTLLKSHKKLSLVIINNRLIFNNSVGDISAIDLNTGKLIWQTPTVSRTIYTDILFLKVSDIIGDKNNVYFSSNKNNFFSINIENGFINWQQKINSSLRPTISDNFIFTISEEGYFVLIDKRNGNIVRSTFIFDRFKEKVLKKIKPVGFILGADKTYLTTNNGKLIIIDTLTGKSENILNIDRDKISRPFVLNQELFIIKDNSIIRLN
tara:strand:- start:5379 stop:6677 length:1299 start_codon:yes stop_codon:yes gene_type:complete